MHQQHALELIEKAEELAEQVRVSSKSGQDIRNNALTGIYATKDMINYVNEEEIKEIMQDLKFIINKLRLALFDRNLTNVELNLIANQNNQ